jgi:hypothetical protein
MKVSRLLTAHTLLFVLMLAAGARAATPDSGNREREPPPVTARVGVVATGDYEEVYNDYQPLFSLMSQYSKGLYRRGETDNHYLFRLAVGSYDDILEWYRRGYINVALLTPGPVGDLLSSAAWQGDLQELYLATEALKPATSPLAGAERRAPVLPRATARPASSPETRRSGASKT